MELVLSVLSVKKVLVFTVIHENLQHMEMLDKYFINSLMDIAEVTRDPLEQL